MRSAIASALVCALLVVSVSADCYNHNPRGSNNRLNEQSAERTNGNRMFDSQNNNRGGYNVGDKTAAAFNANNPVPSPADQIDPTDNTASQYSLMYFEGSILSLEYTVQHGCGGNEANDAQKLNCNINLQYMCDTDAASSSFTSRYGTDKAMNVILRDGGDTNQINSADAAANVASTIAANDAQTPPRGRHENEYHYYECTTRSRNKGLFLADQNLNGNTARFTRQNPGGTRRGLECPEERDYFPYWVPSPWRDIAILTDRVELCPTFLAGSQNTATTYKCTTTSTTAATIDTVTAQNTQATCTANGGTWKGMSHNIAAPACQQVDWSRDNHLGNGRNGYPNGFNWTLPSISALTSSGVKLYTYNTNDQYARCVYRIRYNISTDDYDPYNTTAAQNANANAGVRSPVENNPVVDVGAKFQGLRLAINTNQFGRTFQDRSHVFFIRKRPVGFVGKTIYNLNVRGKRGNIVQTFPSVEYDFVPQRLEVHAGDLIHIQWTGSNTHNNGNPAGDGQAGDAGEGTGGTDRSSFVAACSASDNYPIPLDKSVNDVCNIHKKIDCFDIKSNAMGGNSNGLSVNCALALATSGYYRSVTDVNTKDQMNELLNNAPASFVQGVVIAFKDAPARSTAYHYFSSRNNNFTNRSQKGAIIVLPDN